MRVVCHLSQRNEGAKTGESGWKGDGGLGGENIGHPRGISKGSTDAPAINERDMSLTESRHA